MLGKTGKKALWLGRPAGQFRQAILPIDQLHGQPWRHGSQPRQIILDAGNLAALPAAGEIIKSSLILAGKRSGRVINGAARPPVTRKPRSRPVDGA